MKQTVWIGTPSAFIFPTTQEGGCRLDINMMRPVILAVDDEEVNLHIISNILAAKFDVYHAKNGAAALDFLAENSVDMVLLDYNMPDMNGIDVLKSIKQRMELKNVPVIMMTAESDIELETAVFRAGAADFIRKPFVPMTMQERVRCVIQSEYLKINLQREVARQTKLAEERLAASERLFEETVLALAKTIDAKDKYTQGHSKRVAEYARQIAARFGYTLAEQRDIYCMGLLHDIGKIGVPGAIINKPARLTDEEYEIIKSHTTIGASILEAITHFPGLAIGARYHHERWDGRGYPEGLAGEEIPREARIISVADAYDAMTSRRSYRGVMEQSRVRKEIERGRGNQFDPALAEIMLDMIDQDDDFSMRATN